MNGLRPLPSGVGVALVTMFGDDGETPDPVATAARASACAALGVSSILVAGTTGEASRLGSSDRLTLASAVKDAVGDLPVIVGAGDASERSALETTAKVAAGDAADGLLVFAPAESDPADFYSKVRAEAGPLPVLAYHNPALRSRALDPGILSALPVTGVKDSSGDANRLAELVELGVPVYVGSPTQLVIAGGCGAAGALLALANVAPTLCIEAWNGNLGAQRAIFALQLRSATDFPAFLKSAAPE